MQRMKDFQVNEYIKGERSNTLKKNSAVFEHQVKKKLVKTVGNINRNGAPFTTTATTSSAKISLTSNAIGKSVVSSLSMSLERKDSIRYLPRKIAPYIIPAGRSSVIHLDNYTHVMAQRVTTTKTAFKRSEIISEDQNLNIVPCSTKTRNNSVYSLYDNKETLNMNKPKVQDTKPDTPSKVRGRKNTLALEHNKHKELKINLKKHILESSTLVKPVVKKTNRSGRKKIIKQGKPRKTKIKTKNSDVQDIVDKESDKNELEKSLSLSIPPQQNKILRPCTYTLQSQKCLNEMSCSYLHSEFPCKYYYLNIPCPQDVKCQFMHNGPLEPKLQEALRNHILDLLSAKPSAAETHFVQQIHFIDDLWYRLQSFELMRNQNNEIIEVMDDADDDHVLVIDENSDTNNDTTNTNTSSNSALESDEMHSQYTIDKLDSIYEKFKETNFAVDEIDKKFKSLKTTLNMTPNEKIKQLQIIYDLLKEQERRLQFYENAASTTSQITAGDNKEDSALTAPSEDTLIEKQNIILVNPNIVNDIVTLESQENIANASEEKNVMAESADERLSTKLAVVEGTEFLANEDENFVILIEDENNARTVEKEQMSISSNVPAQIGTEVIEENKEESIETTNIQQSTSSKEPQESGIELLSIEELPTIELKGKNDITSTPKKDNSTNFNLPYDKDYEKTTSTSVKEVFNNSDLNENRVITEQSNDDVQTLNAPCEKKIFDEKTSQIIPKNNSEIADGKNLGALDKNEMTHLNDSLIPNEESLELEITNDEKIIENNFTETVQQDIEEHSPSYEKLTPSKPERASRVRLRSHRLQDNEIINKIVCESLSPIERTRPIRTRRLRLPKPYQKPAEKSVTDHCQINVDVINKLIKSSENTSKETEEPVQDVEIAVTKNLILTKRFLKKAKAKLEMQPQLVETEHHANLNVDQNVSTLRSNDSKNPNGIENIDVSLLTQTSDENYSSNTSLQDPHIMEADIDRMENVHSDVPLSGENYKNLPKSAFSESFNPQEEVDKIQVIKEQNVKRRISYEKPLSALTTAPPVSIKEKYNLGNPQVLLVKLKAPFLLQTSKNEIQADSNSSYINPIVTSSSSLLADDKLLQKRQSRLNDETDSDSSLKSSKYLKFDDFQAVRKITMESKPQQESNQATDVDFESDSNDEKLTITSSYNSVQQQEDFQSSPTHQGKHQLHTHLEHEHKEQTENESDLRQQIENVSNKSDLQLQTQQKEHHRIQQQQKECEKTSKSAATTFITKNSNNLPHKQYKQEESIMVMTAAKEKDEKYLLKQEQCEEGTSKRREISNTCNSYDNTEKDEDGRTQSVVFKCIYKPEKLASNANNNYSNEFSVMEEEINVKYSTYSSLFNKLTNNATKRQINFEDSSVNITPISSPTYGNDDTIASPSPIKKSIDFRMGGEIDGRLTYPPIPYIIYEIDLGKIEVNKPLNVEKLKRTIQLDPRVFRTHIKKQSTMVCKPFETAFNALVPMPSTSNNFKLSHDSSSLMKSTSSISSSYDPRIRSSATMAEIATPSLTKQTALTPYDSIQTAVVPSSMSFMQTSIPDAVPVALQYHSTSQPNIQPQQTPNMFLYGCLQRSPWYQSLMSTMKIQINQSISQLVRALNNFHRKRVFNPEMVFDVFKIDCAGELLEIMRNLGIFVDVNGTINEQRHMPSFAGRTCCNTAPVNATYSFIQQYLTPNSHCTALTSPSSSTYSAACGANSHCHFNANDPFISCYIKAPETAQKHSSGCCSVSQHSHNNDNNCNRNCNNSNDNGRNDDNNRHENNNNNNNYSGRRQFKKPYDNNNDGNNNYQQRSNQRSSYNNNYSNNPRFMKPGAFSPSKSNASPSGSPKKGLDGGGGGGGSYGGRGGRGGGGGRFNNNKRFNNYNKDNNDWSSSGSNDNRYNNKYQNSNSPPRSSSPIGGSPRAAEPKSSPSKAQKSDEECWD